MAVVVAFLYICGLILLSDTANLKNYTVVFHYDQNDTFSNMGFFADGHYLVPERCYEYFLLYSRNHFSKYLKPYTGPGEVTSCRFNFDPMQSHLIVRKKIKALAFSKNSKGVCQIESAIVCDGKSVCLTDECGCEQASKSKLFFCYDGSGCLTFDRLCDDVMDCLDGSDERFCGGFIEVACPGRSEPIFLSKAGLCNNILLLEELKCTSYSVRDHACFLSNSTIEDNPLTSCLNTPGLLQLYHSNYALLQTPKRLMLYFIDYCKKNCTSVKFRKGNWSRHCDFIVAEQTAMQHSLRANFKCGDKLGIISLNSVCDGIHDCKSGEDEVGCPGRFYCSPGSAEWVTSDKICDHVKDCSNGRDECGTCSFGALSSSEILIHSVPVLGVTAVIGIAIIFLNFSEGLKCFRDKKTSKIAKVDRVFRIQIFFYDFLMGLYLCSIVVAAVILYLKSEYCLIERDWRQTPICMALGILYSVSSHGSLLAVAMTSVTRWVTCSTLEDVVSEKSIMVGSIVGIILNVAHSVLPLLPIPEIRDIFRTEIFLRNLDDNPFFTRNPINISHLTSMYNYKVAAGIKGARKATVQAMLKTLENTTNKPSIFETEEISYYGNTGLCVHNVFKLQESYAIYKWIYCVVIAIFLGTVAYTYGRIVLKERKTRAAAGQAADRDPHKSLALKVVLMIGSQLLCWIPFILTTAVLHYLRSPPPPLLHEIFTMVVIPANSFLNPLFYSSIYESVMSWAWRGWRKFVAWVGDSRTPN